MFHHKFNNIIISGSEDGKVIIWDCNSGVPIKTLVSPNKENNTETSENKEKIWTICYLKESDKVIAGTLSGNILVWS